ncbi:lysis protein [Serratia sp. BIGb0234]|uniref:lysis protein n=1 Tax=Serratia sp. BIGb0234 TaxID=2940614 RepID=UPI002167B5D3|nr:lysis protein [Serratia sp. BIGb0234]
MLTLKAKLITALILVVGLFLASLFLFRVFSENAELRKSNSQLSEQIGWQNSTQRAVAAIDEHRTKELNDAKNQINDLQRLVAAGALKLQLSATCPTSGTAGVADATGPRLTDAAERDYYRLRERIEIARSQIAGLQDYIKDVCLKR